jgi:cytochrome c peroxidase
MPADVARASDGTLYVAATGSDRVGVLSAAGAVESRVAVGGGPTGLALDEPRRRLYVLDRFDGELSVVDTAARVEVERISLGYNPEPSAVRTGRRFLYDGSLSAFGDLSCASCNRNGHREGLAWDLGDPTGEVERTGTGILRSTFHPMKGPMTTQSLRGIDGTEPLHWRGDRAKLDDFNPAFESLLGAPRRLTPAELASFGDFVKTLAYPPNPRQNLDRTLPDPATGPSAARGEKLFKTALLDGGIVTCNLCHSADGFGSGTNGQIIPGVLLQEPQDFKVPQLRGMYEKLGMRNAAGEQLAGFGFIHDGSIATLFDFLKLPVFTFKSDDDRRDVEAYVLAFDSGLAPAVGLQLTIDGENRTSLAARERLDLLIAQANAGNCDLVAKGRRGGVMRGYRYQSDGTFQSDRQAETPLTWQALVTLAGPGAEITFTGVPPGAGRRIGIDRDLDGVLDGDSPR